METLAPSPQDELNFNERPPLPAGEHAHLDQTNLLDTQPHDSSITESVGYRPSLGRRVARSVAARTATEVVGIGVDAMLMGAGSAGVSLLENVAARETLATGADVAVLNKLSHHEQSGKLPPSRLRRLGHLAVIMATAVAAQKVGPGIAEHISGNLGHGFVGHFALPLSSKVGATSGVNSILKRTL